MDKSRKKKLFINGVPAAVASPQAWAEILRLPRRKEVSTKFGQENNTYSITFPNFRPPGNSQTVIQRAITGAVTMPYLRSVAALFFTETQVSVRILQSLENMLHSDELIGGLLIAHQGLEDSPHEDLIYFREENATHSVEGQAFVDLLHQTLKVSGRPQILILNVHHDYLTIYHNLTEFHPILQVVCGIKRSPKLK